MLFVNDKEHGRHKQKKKKKKKPVSGAAPADGDEEGFVVELISVFNPMEDTRLVASEDHLYCLNNEYDYAVTQMLRCFLKGDEV